jgi:hypothetical protein
VARLRSDFFVSGLPAPLRPRRASTPVLRRRGAAEGGAIFVKVDRLDGTAALYGPAPQAVFGSGDTERLFAPVLEGTPADVEDRIRRETKFDSDLWLIESDDRQGRHFLDLAPPGRGALDGRFRRTLR